MKHKNKSSSWTIVVSRNDSASVSVRVLTFTANEILIKFRSAWHLGCRMLCPLELVEVSLHQSEQPIFVSVISELQTRQAFSLSIDLFEAPKP